MSNSSLISAKIPAYVGNYTKGRTNKISEITIHHMAGVLTAKRCGELFQTVGRNGSAHYGIGYNGEICQYVDENDTAWTNSNWESNCRAVTIEVSNSENGGAWRISDNTMVSLIKLVADIAKRNGFGALKKGENLTWHRMYAATSCPGEYLISKIDYIVDSANKINAGISAVATTPTSHVLNGTNISRIKNALVLYSGKEKTGTNQWGYEAKIDKNGVVLTPPLYKGNTEIPKDGYVLSGHDEAGLWMYNNIRKGYRLSFSDTAVTVDKRNHRSVDGVNTLRGKGHLTVYNTGACANTNPYGFEVAINYGKALNNPIYGKGKTEIPKNGFVLSGHITENGADDGGNWIEKNIEKGTSVDFDGKVITLL